MSGYILNNNFCLDIDKNITTYVGKEKKIFVPKDGYRQILKKAFMKCDSSYEIIFEEGITYLPPLYFNKSFPTIRYPSTLESIEECSLYIKHENPFDNKKTIDCLLNNPVYQIIDGCMINTKNHFLLFDTRHETPELVIPECVENIGKFAFYNLYGSQYYAYKNLKEHFKDIENNPSYSERLKNLKNQINALRENNKYIVEAIDNRIQLKSITLPQNIKFIDPECFELIYGLEKIYATTDIPVKTQKGISIEYINKNILQNRWESYVMN